MIEDCRSSISFGFCRPSIPGNVYERELVYRTKMVFYLMRRLSTPSWPRGLSFSFSLSFSRKWFELSFEFQFLVVRSTSIHTTKTCSDISVKLQQCCWNILEHFNNITVTLLQITKMFQKISCLLNAMLLEWSVLYGLSKSVARSTGWDSGSTSLYLVLRQVAAILQANKSLKNDTRALDLNMFSFPFSFLEFTLTHHRADHLHVLSLAH